MLKWKKKKEQNKTKALRRVNGCQFLKRELYGVIKMMSVFPNFLGGKENGVFYYNRKGIYLV